MEEINEYETKITEKVHEFYCDDCEKFLMTSKEYDDGWYETPKKFRIQHVELKGHYCEKCGEERVNKVVDYARSMGFDL